MLELQPLVHGGKKRDRGPPKKLTQPVKVSLRELFGHTRGARTQLAGGTLCMLGAALTAMAIPRQLGVVVDQMGDEEGIGGSLVQLAGIVLLRALFSGGRRALFLVAGEDVIRRLRTRLFAAILSRPKAFFDASMSGDLLNRLSSDCVKLRGILSSDGPSALRAGTTIIIGIVMLLLYSISLTGVMLAVVPFVAVMARTYGTRIKRMGRQTQDALALSTAVAAEVVGNISTVKAFAQEDACIDEYSAKVDEAFGVRKEFAVAAGLFMTLMTTAGGASVLLVVWFGAEQVRSGAMSIGDFTAFLMYTLQVGVDAATLAGVYTNLLSALGSSEQVFKLIHEEVAPTGTELQLLRGEVAFEDVGFCYAARPDSWVLRGLSFTLSPGSVVALVGPSGGGKSTVVDLVLRFYDPQEGRITVDGESMTDLDPRWWRSNVGLVSQEPVLFSTSVRNNIAFGNPGASQQDIEEAAHAANVMEFASNFPEGLDEVVGERGVQLSGGQRQRVAIARALVGKPRLLVFDEATSALDAESEHQVQQALDALVQQGQGNRDRAFLVIAHRLSTVRDANEILVLSEGAVVERGSHQALLQHKGVYAALVERQLT